MKILVLALFLSLSALAQNKCEDLLSKTEIQNRLEALAEIHHKIQLGEESPSTIEYFHTELSKISKLDTGHLEKFKKQTSGRRPQKKNPLIQDRKKLIRQQMQIVVNPKVLAKTPGKLVSFDSEGQALFIKNLTGTSQSLYDFKTLQPFRPLDRSISRVVFDSTRGRMALMPAFAVDAQLVDSVNGQKLQNLPLPNAFFELDFSRDGQTVLFFDGRSGRKNQYDLTEIATRKSIWKFHAPEGFATVSPSNQFALTQWNDGEKIRLTDISTNQLITTFDYFSNFRFAAGGEFSLIQFHRNEPLKLFETSKWTFIKDLNLKPPFTEIFMLQDRIVTFIDATLDNQFESSVEVWSVQENKMVTRKSIPSRYTFESLSEDMNFIVFNNGTSQILYDVRSQDYVDLPGVPVHQFSKIFVTKDERYAVLSTEADVVVYDLYSEMGESK